ncbi:MAG: hypothetical protein KIT09_35820 [Bryobacteraceae bacterium]|nr:hypothetical protein [Bryobacteraceae bacterium]
MEYLGPIPIPDVAPSGLWPVPVNYGLVRVLEPQVVAHQFGTGDAKREQRFYLGDGQRRIQLALPDLNTARKKLVTDFWEARRGPYEPFTLHVKEPDGTTSTSTVRFSSDTISLDQVLEHFWSGSIELVEVPAATPVYASAATVVRFPSASLETALLDQVQQIFPIIHIRTLGPAHDLYLSDRRVQVDGRLYQPRLLDWDGIAQEIGGASDSASFTLGNADRALTSLTNAIDLARATLEFSLFHVGTRTRIDLWKGFVTDWSFDAGPEFRIEASDGLYELNCAYPTRLITRQDGFTVPDQPVNIGGRKGVPRITSTSVTNETAYGQPLKDIYCDVAADKPLIVPCDLIAGRDESEFYTALGIVGRGPIGEFGYKWSANRRVYGLLDGQPNHGGKDASQDLYGIRRSRGHSPARDHDPDAGSYSFSLDEVGKALPYTQLDGVAFQQVRIVDEKGIQPKAVSGHRMDAYIARGLGGWTWTAPGARSWQEAITNPIWVAVNVLLHGLNLADAAVADQEAVLDVSACVSAAAVCDQQAAAIIGTGSEKQFIFTGVIGEQKPLRDWIAEILANCLGGYAFAFGKFRPYVRFHSGVAESFQEGNIVKGSLALGSIAAGFNKLVATFADRDYDYQSNGVQLVDTDHQARIERELASNINLAGTASKSQASRIVMARLREELGGLTAEEQRKARRVSFRSTILGLATEPGMVCSLWHPDMPDGHGEFRITGWRLHKDYSLEPTGQSTTDSMYDMLVGDKPTDVVPDIEIPPTEPYVAYVTAPTAALRHEIIDGVHRVHIDGSYRAPANLGEKDLLFAGVELHLETAAGVKPLGWYLWDSTSGHGGDLVKLTVPNLDPPGADETWRVYFCSRSISRKNPLHRKADPPHPKETPYAAIAPAANPYDGAPDVRAFTAGNYDEATGAWSEALEYDASAEHMLIDWACMVPAELWLANWSGVQVWIKRPNPQGGFTYHQATGRSGLDSFQPPGAKGVHYDQIRIERKHVLETPETWTLIACSYDRNGVPKVDEQGIPQGPEATITTVAPPASPFEPVKDAVLGLTPAGSLSGLMGGQNPCYTLWEHTRQEAVGIQFRVTPPSDGNWLRAALYVDYGSGELEPVAEYPYGLVAPAAYDLEPVWRNRPATDQTWRFVAASVGKNGTRNLPDRTKAGTYVDVAVTKIEGIGYPSITGVTVLGDLWEGKQTGALKITLPYTAPASGQFTGVTLFLKRLGVDAEFRALSYHPHLGGADGAADSVMFYFDRPVSDETWEVILSPRTRWHGEDLFRHADDRNWRSFTASAMGAASATGITNAAVGNVTYGQTQDGIVYWGIDHVSWTNPPADVNFYFARLTVQKVNGSGEAAPDYEGVERVVREQQWPGYAVDAPVDLWTLPAADATHRKFRFRLYAVNWKREATLQTAAWSGASYRDVEPTSQGPQPRSIPGAEWTPNVTSFAAAGANPAYGVNGAGQKVLRVDCSWVNPTDSRYGGVAVFLALDGVAYQMTGLERGASVRLEIVSFPAADTEVTIYALAHDLNNRRNTYVPGVTPTAVLTLHPPQAGAAGQEWTAHVSGFGATVSYPETADGTYKALVTCTFTPPADPTWGGVEIRASSDGGATYTTRATSATSPVTFELPASPFAQTWRLVAVSFDVNGRANSVHASTPAQNIVIGTGVGQLDLTKAKPTSYDPDIFKIQDGEFIIWAMNGNLLVTGSVASSKLNATEISVGGGGNKPGKFGVYNASGQQIGFIGVDGGYEGGWFKTLGVGGGSAASAPLYVDSGGVVKLESRGGYHPAVTVDSGTRQVRLNVTDGLVVEHTSPYHARAQVTTNGLEVRWLSPDYPIEAAYGPAGMSVWDRYGANVAFLKNINPSGAGYAQLSMYNGGSERIYLSSYAGVAEFGSYCDAAGGFYVYGQSVIDSSRNAVFAGLKWTGHLDGPFTVDTSMAWAPAGKLAYYSGGSFKGWIPVMA